HATDMAQLMGWADVAITAGGSTCWELACLGLPSVALVLAQNQREIACALAECGAVINLGDASQIETGAITDALLRLIADTLLRSHMHEVGRGLVDGKGALRVVDILSRSTCQDDLDDLCLRRAEDYDALLIWQWANDPVARANSFQREAIPWHTHVE